MVRLAKKFLCITAVSLIVFSCALVSAAVVDKVIIVVNDEVITQREFDRIFQPVKESYEKNFQGDELNTRLEEARKQLIEQVVNSKLTVSIAKEQKIEIDEENLQEKIDRIRAYYASEEEFLQALSAKGTNLTEFEQELREQMLAQELIEKEVASKIIITPARIKEVYEKNREQFNLPRRVKARGIMIRKSSDSPEEAKKNIKKIASELKRGGDFSKIAKEKSEGPYAQNGGDMGYVAPGQMLEEIDAILFSMKKGETSDIVETEVGFHIFKVEEIEEPRIAELSEVSDFIRGELHRGMFAEKLAEWLEEKRKNAYISYK